MRRRGALTTWHPAPTAALIAILLLRHAARADDSLIYKFENYREDDNRITVETQSSQLDQDILAGGHIMLTGTIDAVSGATPTGRPAPAGTDQVPLTEIHTRRKAWNGDYSEQIKDFNISAGFAESREPDYVSRGWSVNTLTDLNEKNTTVRAGIAGTDDRVEVFFEPAYMPKHTTSAIFGVTQILDPRTFVTLNVSYAQDDGYLSEPHKFVEKGIEIFPGVSLEESFGENSPNERQSQSIYASINRAYPKLRGAVEGSYRLYTDDWGITSSTFGLSWIQHVGPRLILEPTARYYVQSSANFYYYNLDSTPIIPVSLPNGTGPNYSSDFRLSAEDDYSLGLKLTYKVADRLSLLADYTRFEMHGRDSVTPASAYPRAGISSVGVKITW
ncbi:MAG TPA: DUF3570 domain-containing protein [Opitutaceae bacterium]|jgi:hypothetical protein